MFDQQCAGTSSEENIEHNIDKVYRYTTSPTLYMPWNNSPPDKSPPEELGIKPWISRSASIDVTTGQTVGKINEYIN